uniref:hypothetical protein n=1 Tax=uncultured Erythrobacter sp. TaxID=263913 RepID=UPI0026378216|nr:hypothetical protein [uncultured Erythrobacter sp.]
MSDTQNLRTSNLMVSAYLAMVIGALLVSTSGGDFAALWKAENSDQTNAAIALDRGEAADLSADLALNAAVRSGTVVDDSGVADPEAGNDAATDEVSLGSPADVQEEPASTVELGVDQFDFELTDSGAITGGRAAVSGELIEVQKPVMHQGERLGSLVVFIDKNARLASDKTTLETLLASDQASMTKLGRISDTGLITFQRLREFGINLRYDPLDDQIVLQSS